MAYRLDIKEVLRRLDKRDFDYFDSLTDEGRKGFAGPVVLRWMSATSSNAESQLWLVNQIANVYFHDLYQHPELQYKLLASCGAGAVRRHEWIPGVKPPKRSSPLREFLLELHPSANDMELDLLYSGLTEVELRRLLDDCATDPARAKIVINDFKKA